MDSSQAQRFITDLTKHWNIPPLDLSPLFLLLEKPGTALPSQSSTFEFSLSSKADDLRLLHLRFFDTDQPFELQKTLCKERFLEIYQALHILSKQRPALTQQQAHILEGVFQSISKTNWPMQFGFTLSKDGRLLLKTYISVINACYRTDDVVLSIGEKLRLEQAALKALISGMELDAIGIDFDPSGNCSLKIYPYSSAPFHDAFYDEIIHRFSKDGSAFLAPFLRWIKHMPLRHIGYLHRITPEASITSTKIWARLEKALPSCELPVFDLNDDHLLTWWNSSQQYLKQCKGAVSYLTWEGDSLGIYFR